MLLQVSGPKMPQLPAAVDVQTVLLLGIAEAAANTNMSILAVNVSSWRQSAVRYALRRCVVHEAMAALPQTRGQTQKP